MIKKVTPHQIDMKQLMPRLKSDILTSCYFTCLSREEQLAEVKKAVMELEKEWPEYLNSMEHLKTAEKQFAKIIFDGE